MNKASKSFKDTIKSYLDGRAAEDELFAKSYAKENKNLDECCNFIVSEVQKMEVNGLSDDEVYSLAVHYYDEDNLGEIKAANANVVVNHMVELTEEEKAEAKLAAMKRIEREEYARLQQDRKEVETAVKKKPVKIAPVTAKPEESPSLFDCLDE